MCERPIEVLRKADPKKDFLLKKQFGKIYSVHLYTKDTCQINVNQSTHPNFGAIQWTQSGSHIVSLHFAHLRCASHCTQLRNVQKPVTN